MSYQPQYRYIPPAGLHILTRLYDTLCFIFGLGKNFKLGIPEAIYVPMDAVIADIGCDTGVFLGIVQKKLVDIFNYCLAFVQSLDSLFGIYNIRICRPSCALNLLKGYGRASKENFMEITPSRSSLTFKPSEPKIDWKYQLQQYGVALAATVTLFVILSVYLFYRRGYYDLYIANKIFAGVSAILLGIVLLIGPLSRFFSFPDRYVQYRKELGIVTFFLALTHGIVSFFFLSSTFPSPGFLGTLNWPFVFGLAATIVLVAIFFISNDRAMTALGRERWWQLQYWGVRLVFVLVFLHVFVMKWDGWIKWYKVGGSNDLIHPEWPGAGLLVGWFMAFVALVRLAEFVSPRLGRVAWYASVIALPVVYIATFWWGRQFVK